MSTITLPLLTLRDILVDWAHTPELNAARAFEARQMYHAPDRWLGARIVPAALARAVDTAQAAYLNIADLDAPLQPIFHVQIKTLAPADRDSWIASPEYGVLWPAAAWRQSVEYKITASEEWLARKTEFYAAQANEDRLCRMVDKFLEHIPPALAGRMRIDLVAALRGAANEDAIREIILQLEKAVGHDIYELPPAPSLV